MTRLPLLSGLTLATLAALLAGCASPAPRPPLHLTIRHTNDHHGRFWANRDGEGGLAARKTLIDGVRAEVAAAAGGHTLLLDGGDVNTGVPESDLQPAEPDFKGMNPLGYDAMAVGNHEFDHPPAVEATEWVPLLRRLNTHPGYIDSGYNDADLLRAYIAQHSPLKVADFEPGDAVSRH